MKDVQAAARDFIRIFNGMKVPYAMMGGLAVRAYGVPRPTYDVDAVLAISDDRLPDLYDAVEAAGYTVPDSYRTGWVDRIGDMPLVKFRIYRGTPDQSVDVDVFLVHTAFQKSVMMRRQLADIEHIGRTWLVSPEDIVLQKLIAGRHRDRGDIEDIRFMCGELDESYMRHWAEHLGVAADLEEVLRKPPI